jgi:[ribosomal protein S18]-alanine N-acetyltransferase
MTTDMTITPADAQHIDEIMPIMASAFDPLFGEAWSAPQCAGMLSLPGTRLFIARSKGNAIGFALFRVILDEAELLLLAVGKDSQRTGVGATLLKELLTEAKANGIKTVHLEVRENNDARRFYTRNGFTETGHRKNYYRGIAGQLTDSVTLTKQV